MRRIIGIIVVTFVLTACASQDASRDDEMEYQGPKTYSVVVPGVFYRSIENGIYYMSSVGTLMFYDYEEKEDVEVCTKTNCTHKPWDESVPEEQRCDAYLDADNLFVIGDELYYFTSQTEGKVELHKANLDLTEKKEICSLEAISVGSVVVTDTHIYGNMIRQPKKEDIEINGSYTAKNRFQLFSISLSDGSVEFIGNEILDYANQLFLKGMVGDHLIYEYFYTKEDAMAATLQGKSDEIIDYWELRGHSVKDGEWNKIQEAENQYIINGYLLGEQYVYSHVVKETESEYGLEVEAQDLILVDIETKEKKIVARMTDKHQWFDQWVFYEDRESKEFYKLNLATEETEEGDYKEIHDYWIYSRDGKYLYGEKKLESAEKVFLEKDALEE